jgi:hypothetical protein
MAGANDRPTDRLERVNGGIDADACVRRAQQFMMMTQRKGMPLTWGTGKLRDDPAWKKDQKRRVGKRG